MAHVGACGAEAGKMPALPGNRRPFTGRAAASKISATACDRIRSNANAERFDVYIAGGRARARTLRVHCSGIVDDGWSTDAGPGVAMTPNGTSKHERAYAVIRQRILDGTYRPGRRLVIGTLAAELGVSPVPVREAIRRLEAEGRVVYRHNAGPRVAPVDGRRSLRVGVDVGHSSTDAVLMDGRGIVAVVKTPSTSDVGGNVAAALEALMRDAHVTPAAIAAVMIGTTHFADAFAERRVAPVACIRLGLPATAALPPMIDWPDDMRAAVGDHWYLAHGGHEVDGRVLSAVDAAELRAIAVDVEARGIRAVALSAVFSPLTAAAEEQAAALLRNALPGIDITLSHQVGRMGLLERENGAIINASLRDNARTTVAGLRETLGRLGLIVPFYLTQNDGTLMTSETAACFPVLTFATGAANSIRGAGFLAGRHDGIVIDAGGTTTTIGVLAHGFPRETEMPARIRGVRTNVRMPDVQSLAFGGGSIVTPGPWRVGPPSVGRDLTSEALVFGGHTLTIADLAVAAGLLDLGEPGRVAHLSHQAPRVLGLAGEMLRRALDRVRGGAAQAPVLMVGGAAPLLRSLLPDDEVIVPEHHAVANAVGAATAPISGEVDRIVALEGVSRQEMIAQAVSDAVAQAVLAGANSTTVRIVSTDEVPLAYLPGNITRVRVKAIGELALEGVYA